MNNLKVRMMHAEVSAALERLSELFKPGMKITFIARLPGNGEADVLIGDDHDANELIALVRRRFGTSTVSATSSTSASAPAAADEVRDAALEEADEAIRAVLWQVENGDGLRDEVYGVERCRDAVRALRTEPSTGADGSKAGA